MMRVAEMFQLTGEQRSVVEWPVEARVLVTAGPGTGKTHTMIARIYHLVNELNVAPGSEVLVLTFTRAAVREIRKRCRIVGGRLEYVSASTFDSFASRLLRHFQPEALDWATSYDGRIQAALRLIETSEETRTWLSRYQHVFVDEIQDLVGVRSRFVKAILEHSGAGFSLFGDPAQSIYNFQLVGPEREIGSKELYGWLNDRFPDLVTRSLTINHRAQTKLARFALHFGQMLGNDQVDYKRAYKNLVNTIDSYELNIQWEQLGQTITSLAGRGRLAVLCRTNGECLLVSRHLWDQGIPHVVRRPAEDRYIPKWVAIAFRSFNGFEIRASALKERLSKSGVPDPETVYASLRRLTGGTGSGLRVSDLRERLNWGLVDDLEPEDDANVVVSTIHRAKGLEFDAVIFLWNSPVDEQDFPGEEARVLYVALTRPRKVLIRADFQGFQGLTYDDCLERWLIRRYGWKLRGIEVRTTDVAIDRPPGSLFSSPEERLEIQSYLAERVNPGDPVTLVNADPHGRLSDVYFHIEHNGIVIGNTNQAFSKALRRAITGAWRPGRIHKLWIAGVRTVVGPPEETVTVGLGSHGFWLIPEIGGIGVLSN